jgi:hypothetical protein
MLSRVSAGNPSLVQLSANVSYNHVMLSVRMFGVGYRLQGATNERVDQDMNALTAQSTCFVIAHSGVEGLVRKETSEHIVDGVD